MSDIESIRRKHGFIIDMDGVVYHGNRLLPGTAEFLQWHDTDDLRKSRHMHGSRHACVARLHLHADVDRRRGLSALNRAR